MKFAYATPGSNDLPSWIAYEEGFWKKQNLNVEMSYVEGSTVAIPALTSGELGIVDAAPATSVQAQLKGADTVALSMHVPYSNVHLMAINGSIKTLQDTKGKAIGSTKAGSADDVVIRAILKREGLTPDKDVNLTYLGTQPAELAALQQGVVQVTMSPAPYNFAADTWVQGVQITSDNPRALHHANLAHGGLKNGVSDENFVTGYVPASPRTTLPSITSPMASPTVRLPSGECRSP